MLRQAPATAREVPTDKFAAARKAHYLMKAALQSKIYSDEEEEEEG